jgi:hypothetical protein
MDCFSAKNNLFCVFAEIIAPDGDVAQANIDYP